MAPGMLVVWCASTPTMTFSRAVIWANRRIFWKVRAMPLWVMRYRLRPTIDWPSNWTSPLVGLNTPGDDVEDRRLAGAVGADQGEDLA